mmetsp:Transcript_22313/g.69914  ORF Transcript_22313/g.69914 Transcript_22313/m.69914 type:complete len:207 (+) Transcript_22313:109-729(+)
MYISVDFSRLFPLSLVVRRYHYSLANRISHRLGAVRAHRGRAERFFKEMTRLLLRLCREAVERLHHTMQLSSSGILDGRLELSRRLSVRRRHLLLRLGLGPEALPLLDQRPLDQLVEARVAHPVHAWVQAPPFDRSARVKVLKADPRRVGAAVPPPHRPVGAVLDQVIPHHHVLDAGEDALDAPHHRVLLFVPLANHVPRPAVLEA